MLHSELLWHSKFSEIPCSSCVGVDCWRQQALATYKIRLLKHLIKDISFWKWVLWTWRCFLLHIASPKQDTTSFHCLWRFIKYYPRCVCDTLCPFLHTSEALEQICTLQRILTEVFLSVSDFLKKALCNLTYPFLKGASVSYKPGWIVTWACFFFPYSLSYCGECKGAYFDLMQVF